jgi:hypothetical protein
MICDLKKLELEMIKPKLMAISISRIYLQKKGQKFSMYAKFSKLTSSYDDLIVILPTF